MNLLTIERLSKTPLRLISIDPGGGKAGYAVLEYDFDKKKFKIIHMETRTGNELASLFFDSAFRLQNEDREVKNLAHSKYLTLLLKLYKPHFVAIEGAYARQISAFRSLVEHATYHRAACYNYDPYMEFATIAASEAKRSMGVKGNTGDKTLITKALTARAKVDLEANGNVFSKHEEHANDAVAIGIAAVTKVKDKLGDDKEEPKSTKRSKRSKRSKRKRRVRKLKKG